MNSCLYETEIMHHRLTPKEHKFSYKFFSFYLDLDEIDNLAKTVRLFSHNKFNVYALCDRDHFGTNGQGIKQNILGYLKSKGVNAEVGRIMLLAYLRTWGYVFNPVSFYFCFDRDNQPLCVVPEIGNTFGELKPFMIPQDHLQGRKFKDSQVKYYYISPFMRLDDRLDFKLTVPDERLNICIDTARDGAKVILTTMMGPKVPFTNRNLLWMTVKFPFVTLKVIALIHWHALRLWIKRIPYEEKTSNPHLQKEVYRARN